MQGLLPPTEPSLPTPGFEITPKGGRHRSGSGNQALRAGGEPFSSHIEREDHRSVDVDLGEARGFDVSEPPQTDRADELEEAPAGSADHAQDAHDPRDDAEGADSDERSERAEPQVTPSATVERSATGSERPGGASANRPATPGTPGTNPMTGGPASSPAPATPGSVALDASMEPVQPRTAAREDLAALLEDYGVRGTRGKGGSAGGHAAVARAEQVQQAIALEQAAQQLNPGGRSLPGGMQSVSLEPGATDARQAVLNSLPLDDTSPDALQQRIGRLTGRALGALASQRGGTLTMRLDPPNLGQITLRMSVIDATVRTEIIAQNQAARQLLDRSIDVLRMTLESRGLQVERLAVSAPATPAETGGTRTESQEQQAAGDGTEEDARDAAGGESRGRRDREPSAETSDRGARQSFQETLSTD